MRKITMALAAAFTLGSAAMATSALAQHGHAGGAGGGGAMHMSAGAPHFSGGGTVHMGQVQGGQVQGGQVQGGQVQGGQVQGGQVQGGQVQGGQMHMGTTHMAAPMTGGQWHGGAAIGGNAGTHFAYRGRHDHFRGGFGGLYAFGGPSYYDDYYYDDGCLQRELVATPVGPRWRWVNVCY